MPPIDEPAPEELSGEIVESYAQETAVAPVGLPEVLREMGNTYRANPVVAVRGQAFIKLLHDYVAEQLTARLTKFARRRGIEVRKEAVILGATKPKDVDVAVIDPANGPLVLVGVRSQMSSIGKNVLTYYEGIVGECISLQERFPMSTHGYVYLHPLHAIKEGREREVIDHVRYARMYAAVTGRAGVGYKNQRGVFDQFAYMVVDFGADPPTLRDDLAQVGDPGIDMRLATFVDRLVETSKSRMLFWDVFD